MKNEKVNSIVRMTNILECFTEDKEEWGIIELAEKVALPQSTTYRIVNTLCDIGYIKQNGNSKKYKIGNRLIWLTNAIVSKHDIKSIARPYLQKLSELTEETVHLCGLDGMDMFYIEKIETSKSIRVNSRRGGRLKAHISAAGKVLLSGQSEEFIENYCKELPNMKVATANSITDSNVLKEQLRQVRQNGYAIDNEEAEELVMCFASPIYDKEMKIVSALSITGPKFRMEENFEELISVIKKATADLSNELKSIRYIE